MFRLTKETSFGRRGTIQTSHGALQTPLFMPVGTLGAMKGLAHEDILSIGAEMMLCNTYHLHLQPGEDVVKEAGGLHSFIGWEKPILTDSGGFQVFSLRTISDITDAGVHFRSHLNGDPLFIGPAEAMRIQHALAADIIMAFDECPPSTAKRAAVEKAVERTLVWAKECKKQHEAFNKKNGTDIMLFGIVQGGVERDLREKCAMELQSMGFDGYAIGGLAVGESEKEMFDILDAVCPLLPKDKPRYLMGVGKIEQLKTAVSKGIDMFDCVLPMREARHGTLYLADGSRLRMRGASYIHDHSVIDANSPSPLSRKYSKSYLCHLLRSNERFGETIACMNNLAVTLQTIREIREKIEKA